jgi:hypothetical protein
MSEGIARRRSCPGLVLFALFANVNGRLYHDSIVGAAHVQKQLAKFKIVKFFLGLEFSGFRQE